LYPTPSWVQRNVLCSSKRLGSFVRVGGWEKTKRDNRGRSLSNVVCGCLVRQLLAHVPESVRQFFRGVVGLNGLGLDEDSGVATLDVGRGGRDGTGDVARSQDGGGSDDHQGNSCPDDL